MLIRARLLEMAESEIFEMIPTNQYLRIKQQDPNPLFRAYVIGHEGESEGRLVGIGHVVKRWYKSAVEKIKEKLQFGLKLFHEHGETNETTGRQAIGEVVGKAIKNIEGKLSAIMIGYIKPEFRNLPLDVASMEADIRLNENAGIYDADVDRITGVALGSSAINRPGFQGATLLGQIQAFASSRSSQFNQRGNGMTVDEIIEFIKTEKLNPSDLFDLKDLAGDPSVKGLLDVEKKKTAGEFRHRERTDDKFKEESEQWEKDKKELEEENKKLKSENIKAKVIEIFPDIAKERKFDEKQIAFIKPNLKDFATEDPENVEKELHKFLDNQIDQYKKIAKDVFGVEVKEEKEGGEKEETKEEKEGEEKEESEIGNPFIQESD